MTKVERALLAPFGLELKYWGDDSPDKRWYPRVVIHRNTGVAICNERGYRIADAIPS